MERKLLINQVMNTDLTFDELAVRSDRRNGTSSFDAAVSSDDFQRGISANVNLCLIAIV